MPYSDTPEERARLAAQGQAVLAREVALLTRLAAGTPARILDVGCGPGSAAPQLKRAFPWAKLWGIEQNAGSCERAESGGHYEAVFPGRIPTAGEPGATFDLVYSRAMLRHTADPAAAVAWMWRRVRSGGQLILADADDATLLFHPEPPGIRGALARARQNLPRHIGSPTASSSGRTLMSLLAGMGAVGLTDDALILTASGSRDGFARLAMPVLAWGCAKCGAGGEPLSLPSGEPDLNTAQHTALMQDLHVWKNTPGAFASWTLFYAAGIRP